MLHTKNWGPNFEHIRNFKDKLHDIACIDNNTFLLNKLVSADVRDNKQFYHANCLKRLENEYTKELKVANENNSQAWIKALAFNKLANHIYDRNVESPGVIFNGKLLEKIHIGKVDSNDIYITSHVEKVFNPTYKFDWWFNCKKCWQIIVNSLLQRRSRCIVLGAPHIFKKLCFSVSTNCWANSVWYLWEWGLFQRIVWRRFTCKVSSHNFVTFDQLIVDGSWDSINNYSQSLLTPAQIITSNYRKKKASNMLFFLSFWCTLL